MQEKAQLIAKLHLDQWEKLLLENIFIQFFIHGIVFGQNCEWAQPLGWVNFSDVSKSWKGASSEKTALVFWCPVLVFQKTGANLFSLMKPPSNTCKINCLAWTEKSKSMSVMSAAWEVISWDSWQPCSWTWMNDKPERVDQVPPKCPLLLHSAVVSFWGIFVWQV